MREKEEASARFGRPAAFLRRDSSITDGDFATLVHVLIFEELGHFLYEASVARLNLIYARMRSLQSREVIGRQQV